MAYPLEQGLKLLYVLLLLQHHNVLMAYPLEQGLKLEIAEHALSMAIAVLMAYPLEQGLKPQNCIRINLAQNLS